ncbi:hypothetical protein [Tomitella gaofuii]|uniref:hypothetical protein n=1 Tax=Tomitella gaofuii TaxID=2760083 RepID=UPI0015FCBF4F|nr:hypothetical protein [Tomitella gaofuii]
MSTAVDKMRRSVQEQATALDNIEKARAEYDAIKAQYEEAIADTRAELDRAVKAGRKAGLDPDLLAAAADQTPPKRSRPARRTPRSTPPAGDTAPTSGDTVTQQAS